MTTSGMDTALLQDWLQRMRGGDQAAREELLRHLCSRLERLARKMLRRFPRVKHWVQTDDVLQNSLLRLLRALEKVQPESTRAFFGLAAEQMRRELIDLARHFYGPRGIGTRESTRLPDDSAPSGDSVPADQADDWEDLERWYTFHTEVEGLPVEEREVVGLVFYHGWTQAQVAELLQVSPRTVRRWWMSALDRLYDTFQGNSGETPEPGP